VSAASALHLAAFHCRGKCAWAHGASTLTSLEPYRVIIVEANLLCLYMLVGRRGVVLLIAERPPRPRIGVGSSSSSPHSVDYLAQFWEPAQKASRRWECFALSPLFIFREAPGHGAICSSFSAQSAILWTTGGVDFRAAGPSNFNVTNVVRAALGFTL